MLILLTGAFAGALHVLSGPDHLAAVAPLAVATPRRGWLTGWTWGLGHASGVVAVALLAVLLRDALPSIDHISLWSERLVGGALIALGAWGLRRGARIKNAGHMHGRLVHDHLHIQAGPVWLKRLGHIHMAFCLGVLHGVAGSSHFFGVLPALALPNLADAATYIGAFGVGTIVSMSAFSAVMSRAGARAHTPGYHRALMTASALAAIVVGGVWLVGGHWQ